MPVPLAWRQLPKKLLPIAIMAAGMPRLGHFPGPGQAFTVTHLLHFGMLQPS